MPGISVSPARPAEPVLSGRTSAGQQPLPHEEFADLAGRPHDDLALGDGHHPQRQLRRYLADRGADLRLAVAVGETQVKRVDLVRSLDAMADSSKDRFIFLRADRSVPYGEMMDVLEILRAGGYSKIKLVALEGVPDTSAAPAAPGNTKP